MQVIIDVDKDEAGEIEEEIVGPFFEANLEAHREEWAPKECVVVNLERCLWRRRHPNSTYRKLGCFLVLTAFARDPSMALMVMPTRSKSWNRQW